MRLALIAIAALASLWTAPTQAAWRRAESPNFVVFSTASEEALRGATRRLEDYDRLLRIFTGIAAPRTPNKLHVYIVDRGRELRLALPLPTSTAGFYAATPYGIAAFVNEDARADQNEVLFHEYAHHFMMQFAPFAYPAWYVEGFAEYFGTVRFRGPDAEVGRYSSDRTRSFTAVGWMPMRRVMFSELRELSLAERWLFYAQSWLAVHYFYSTPERKAALKQYLVALLDKDPIDAFEAETGMSPERFNTELLRYGRGRIAYQRLTGFVGEAPSITVTALPESADDLLAYEAALRIGLHEDLQSSRLRRIRAAAAKHADDAYARRVLAHAEALYGDAATADPLLDSLLAATPDDAELLYLKGMRFLKAGDARTAKGWFARAHRADENHFQSLYRYAESLKDEPDSATENTSNILMLAHQLAPQVAEIRLNAASMLMRRGKFDDAESLLKLLAADAHADKLALAAQKLLQEVRARRGAVPVKPAEDSEEVEKPAGDNL